MKVIFLIVLIGLPAYIYSESCPTPGEMKDICSCKEMEDTGRILVQCHEVYIIEEIDIVSKVLSGKENVELELYNFGILPSNFFHDIGVKRLVLEACKLQNLTQNNNVAFLSDLEDTLEKLEILRCDPEEIDSTLLGFGHLHKLESLEIVYHTMKLNKDWFKNGPDSLQYIVLTYNDIKDIADNALDSLVNLKELWLERNGINAVQRSMFPKSAEALTLLSLEGNKLASLPEGIFSEMPSLTTIKLSRNDIKKMERSTWEEVWEQVDEIHMMFNPLHCDSHMNWMFDLRVPQNLFGYCETPMKHHFTSLKDFIISKGN